MSKLWNKGDYTMKWLWKVPKSAEQVLAIINEANDAYANFKDKRKQDKEYYEKALRDEGIFVNSEVLVAGKESDGPYIISNITGDSVRATKKSDGSKWRLHGFKLILTNKDGTTIHPVSVNQ